MVLQDNGLLEPGLHDVTVDDIQDCFVKQFGTSQRRKDIFESLVVFLENLMENYRIYEVWVDGSFVTSKINPNDVDIVVYFECEDFVSISREWNRLRAVTNIDAYAAIAVNSESKAKLSQQDFMQVTNQRNYWRGQFGFDRADSPKGLLVVSGSEWENFIKGRGETDVINVN